MLRELKIQNLVLIHDLNLKIDKGFSVITGETGAGKSILLSALKILGGEKASLMMQDSTDFLKIEAIFDLPKNQLSLTRLLGELEIDFTDELIMERKVYKSGKNRCRLNGTIVKMSDLKKISLLLFDIYGQHEHHFLNDIDNHLLLLDNFGGLIPLRGRYAAAFKEWKSHLFSMKNLQESLEKNREQQDFFRYQFKELDDAGLNPGEDDRIEKTLAEILGLETIQRAHSDGLAVLSDGQGSIKAGLQSLEKSLEELAKVTPFFDPAKKEVQNVSELIEEVYRKFTEYEFPQTVSPTEIDSLNARLARWQRLQVKYKTDMAGLIELKNKRKTQLESLANSEFDLESLNEKISASFKKVEKLGLDLRKKRLASAKKFDSLVNANLSHLGMEQAEISSQWVHRQADKQDAGSITESGMDEVSFFLAANKGHPARPLKAVASGGETSRIMLAIKSVLAEWDFIPLLVFDEIDTGIGGITGNRIGDALKKLSHTHQVLAITHLHQVAACADSQINVSKKMEKGKAFTSIQILSEPERIVELARMMGDDSSKASLKHAQNILQEKP